MKLIRLGPIGNERPALLLDDDRYVDLSTSINDYDETFFRQFDREELQTLAEAEIDAGRILTLQGERIGAPIARPHQIVCIGLNYRDHARETNQDIPAEPIIFSKSPNTLVGPYDDVLIPRGATKTDWEVELGLVISKQARYLDSPASARDHIAGYLISNDVSERAFQMERGGQWMKGKSAETFNPAGPYLVTPDEADDVMKLRMQLAVNGQIQQTGSTSTMIFDPYYIVFYLSQFMVLEPGDLINTGTPPGVGMGKSPQVWLKSGDVMELSIEGLGSQRQEVRNA
jgi:2-keto-4-pentenoate hydratase/2-oxohepta-3-ene-1,7-dioic acid hydratase in catechol pathway